MTMYLINWPLAVSIKKAEEYAEAIEKFHFVEAYIPTLLKELNSFQAINELFSKIGWPQSLHLRYSFLEAYEEDLNQHYKFSWLTKFAVIHPDWIKTEKEFDNFLEKAAIMARSHFINLSIENKTDKEQILWPGTRDPNVIAKKINAMRLNNYGKNIYQCLDIGHNRVNGNIWLDQPHIFRALGHFHLHSNNSTRDSHSPLGSYPEEDKAEFKGVLKFLHSEFSRSRIGIATLEHYTIKEAKESIKWIKKTFKGALT